MKEFVEKLLDRLEDEKQRLRKLKNNTIALSDSEVIAIEEGAYDFCKKIINELSEEYKPKTNADKLRNMTNDELANFLDNVFNNIFDGYEFPCEFCTERMNCDICFNDWLDNEVKE